MILMKKGEKDLTEGPFLGKLIVFAVPMIVTALLQTAYNAVDVAVVGFFRGQEALAAVGSTGSLFNVIVNLFMGLSVGAGVLVAQYIGAKEHQRVSEVVHSSVLLAVLLGVFVSVLGVLLAPELLRLMDTPDIVHGQATLYLRIIFCGIPALLLYNYCAAVLRSSGDTKHPLLFLSFSGVLNVVLNVIFVAVLGRGVDGVALATVLSQYFSAGMILVFLSRHGGVIHFSPRKLRFHRSVLGRMLYIGIPSGIQSSLLSLSNVLIQSSINRFGDAMMAGNSAAYNLENFVYTPMAAVGQATQTFVGQNVGAKKPRNLPRILGASIAFSLCIAVLGSAVILIFREPLVGLYAPENAEVLRFAVQRLFLLLPFSFLLPLTEAFGNALLGMGQSIYSMFNYLQGYCLFRIFWTLFIVPVIGTSASIYYSYPISWWLVATVGIVLFFIFYRRLRRKNMEE